MIANKKLYGEYLKLHLLLGIKRMKQKIHHTKFQFRWNRNRNFIQQPICSPLREKGKTEYFACLLSSMKHEISNFHRASLKKMKPIFTDNVNISLKNFAFFIVMCKDEGWERCQAQKCVHIMGAPIFPSQSLITANDAKKQNPQNR